MFSTNTTEEYSHFIVLPSVDREFDTLINIEEIASVDPLIVNGKFKWSFVTLLSGRMVKVGCTPGEIIEHLGLQDCKEGDAENKETEDVETN